VTEFRRILLDGYAVQVERKGDNLVAPDGRLVAIKDAKHLPPAEPTKIIAVHLNYDSRTKEFMTKLPPAPTYFMKPVTALNSHGGAVVRPQGCKWLNYEGEIVIVIGKTCRNISPAEAGE
jgi:5-oxopent-3-ene-1,2,5-tricarboxylate decarboxylase/2-hydroxyhepta-2,4-diene-1,7-dioate isomerase